MGAGIIGMFGDFLGITEKLSRYDKKVINATIQHALNQTRVHIARTRKTHEDIPSAILSTLWMETAQKIQNINNDEVQQWGKMLEQKAKYWSDPNGYDEYLLNNYEIRLTEVEKRLNELVK